VSKIDPTCLPWQIKHDFDTEGATTIIGNVDGEIIDGMTHHTFDFVARTLDLDDDSQSRSVAIANAAFIVRACNSHRALVEALVELVGDELCGDKALGKRSETEFYRPVISWAARARARAAIAKAKGEQA
jgi:hypothetical protein